MQLYGLTPSFHSGFRITGTFSNPAPYAIYLAAIFPLAFGIVLRKKKFDKTLMTEILYYTSLVTSVAIALVLPATLNRASWLGVVAGSLPVLNSRFGLFNRLRIFNHNLVRRVLTLFILVLLIGSVGIGLFYLKKGSSVGRLLIWEVTLNKIVDKPLFGFGVGRFEAEYNNWQAEYFTEHPEDKRSPKGLAAGNTKYCFNEYFELTSETGLIGLLLFLLVIFSALAPYIKQVFLNIPEKNSIVNLISPSLVTILFCALVSFPFFSLPTNIVFFTVISLLSSQTKMDLLKPFRSKYSHSVHRSFSWIAGMSLILVSVLIFRIAKNKYEAYYTWDKAEKLYQTGNYKESCNSFSDGFTSFRFTGKYLQYYGKALFLCEDYDKSFLILRQAQNYTSDEVLYTTLGEIYQVRRDYNESEKAYLYASNMVPGKLFPKYLLANMYFEAGNNGMALRIAEDILSQKVKVESSATAEIKERMKLMTEEIKAKK